MASNDHATFLDSVITTANRIVAAWLNDLNNFVWRGSRPTYGVTTGAANVYVLTLPATSLYTAATDGDTFLFKAHQSNTGAATFSVVGGSVIAAVALQMNGAALSGNEIQSGGVYSVTRVGAVWQVSGQIKLPVPLSLGGTGLASVGTKGNLLAGTGTAYAELAVGGNGLALVGDSSQTTGLAYALLANGQCQLTKSGANLLLSPYGGNKLIINSLMVSVPDAGITLAPPAVASTTYYIYAFMNAGTMTLENSTTVPVAQAGTGIKIKTGDATRSLVGMARTTAGNAWLDDTTSCLVLSYFNRRFKAINNPFTANRSTASGTYTEVNTEIRTNFLTWADEAISVSSCGTTNNSAASATATAVAFDSTSTPDFSAMSEGNTAAADGPMSLAFVKSGLTEGFHFATLVGSVSGGTGTWYGGVPAGTTRNPFCSLSVAVRG